MSYSKTKWGYSLKAVMKMKTNPQQFQWFLRGTVPDSRWGDIERWLLTRITMFLLSALWKPGQKAVRCFTVLTVIFFKIYVWVL